jgi:hypothetical protein
MYVVTMAQTAKNRRYPRVGLPRGMQVQWQGVTGHVVSRVGTLGLGGLFIAAVDPPPAGDVIQIYFRVPDGEVRARAIVRDSHPGKGMGIEFTSMGAEERARLHRLICRLLDDTAS